MTDNRKTPMDKSHILEVAPHYLMMMFLILVVFNVIRFVYGEIGLWVELAIAFAIVFSYRPVVKYLGVAPTAWED